ncbi:MAG: hypothetical protein IJ688_03690 [Treponema sp.]|nr:hypothetical protein [Treponema sp.]
MKRFLICFLCFAVSCFCVFSEENTDKQNFEPEVKIELVTPVLGMIGFDNHGFIQWYDFGNQTVVENKEIISIISENEKSSKLLKKRNFNYILATCLGTIGVAGIISSHFIDNPEVKDICSSLGCAVCVSTIIPLYIGEWNYYKAISAYNMESLNLKK